MLRGSANSVVVAVRVSTLATMIVSVRAPVRSGPASVPRRRTLSRGGSTGPAGGSAADPGDGPPAKTRSSRARWVLARSAAVPSGTATAAQRAAETATPRTWCRGLRPPGSVAT